MIVKHISESMIHVCKYQIENFAIEIMCKLSDSKISDVTEFADFLLFHRCMNYSWKVSTDSLCNSENTIT